MCIESEIASGNDTFVSYSQNYEDVMLWRALKHIKGGFYVDVGANDPVTASVTKLFYDNGWNGINIEPCLSPYERLVEERPNDINLRLLAASDESQLTFYEFDDSGWSTMDKRAAKLFSEQGNEIRESLMATNPLEKILDDCNAQTIHFLKIDVEGAEKSVIEGMSFSKHRPWILVIESTVPGTANHNHNDWEGILLSNDYEFVYDDGLNRYYLAKEHLSLKHFFKYPPNVFDCYMPYSQVALDEQCSEISRSHEAVIAELNECKLQLNECKLQLNECKELYRKTLSRKIVRSLRHPKKIMSIILEK